MTKRITMQDVADKLGVSKVTVSRALTGKTDISDAMREKIVQAAKELGYLYNSKGKMLRDNQTYSIGIITPEKYFGQDAYFYLDLYKIITDKLEHLNYTSMFHILNSENEKDFSVPLMLLEQKVDGLIILGQLSKSYLKKLEEYQFPMVFLDFYYDGFDIDSIITDNFFATYELTNYLIESGHQKIAYVGNVKSTSSIQDRYLGYCKSMLEYDLELKDQWLICDKDYKNSWVDIQLPEDMPTAFVCNCDQTALYLIHKLKAEGFNVPEDCSVVGFDDSKYASMEVPHITTMRVDLEELGGKAIRMILKRMKDFERPSSRVLVKTKLIERNSVEILKNK